jgi:hypothetical protein
VQRQPLSPEYQPSPIPSVDSININNIVEHLNLDKKKENKEGESVSLTLSNPAVKKSKNLQNVLRTLEIFNHLNQNQNTNPNRTNDQRENTILHTLQNSDQSNFVPISIPSSATSSDISTPVQLPQLPPSSSSVNLSTKLVNMLSHSTIVQSPNGSRVSKESESSSDSTPINSYPNTPQQTPEVVPQESVIITPEIELIETVVHPTEETKNSNFKHRPIGLGIQGLADVFCILNILIEICKTPKKFLMRLLKIEIEKKFLVFDFVFES